MNFLGNIYIFVKLLRACVGESVVVDGIIATLLQDPLCIEKVIVGLNPVAIEKVCCASKSQNVIASLLLRYVHVARCDRYLLETVVSILQIFP